MQNKNLDLLCKSLAVTFINKELLSCALTHRSYASTHNERLEFLGDTVLNFIITEHLYCSFPKTDEGVLTRMRAGLVNGKTLASIAKDFNLGDYLSLGIGEMRSGGFERSSILADTLEAIIGAVYLDAGMDKCKQWVLHLYQLRLQNISEKNSDKDAKTTLQELLQSKQQGLPVYEVESITGEDHDQVFTITCTVAEFMVIGIGKSRRIAEQEAAKQALKFLGVNYD